MRRLADARRIRAFMDAVGRAARMETRLYFTGGATAVLNGWRSSTIDVDILMIPEDDQVFRCLPELKESLELNIELASPADFIPEVPGWQDRSPAIERRGKVAYYHYDLYAQALAKIERGHAQDEVDVQEMMPTRRPAADRESGEVIDEHHLELVVLRRGEKRFKPLPVPPSPRLRLVRTDVVFEDSKPALSGQPSASSNLVLDALRSLVL
jgi:hypothetical protein